MWFILSWPLGRYMKWAMDPKLPLGEVIWFDRLFQFFGGRLEVDAEPGERIKRLQDELVQ